MKKESILIIGGGATGLMAANLLAGQMEVAVLEAKAETGGRINSLIKEDKTIETGAEFIHGKLPLTFNLLAKAGIKTVPVKGKMYHFREGQFVNDNKMAAGWDKLLDDIKEAPEDMTLVSFLETYYSAQVHGALRKEVAGYAESFDLADITKASIKSLYAEWNAEDGENFRIPSGYGSLTQYMEQQAIQLGAKIMTGKIVRQIDWQPNDVSVYTAEGEEFKASKLLVTIPVSVLAKINSPGSINFTPEIDSYRKAAGQIGYGSVIKVVLEFNHRFWPAEAGFIISDELFKTWWTQLPDTSAILTGWLGGPGAENLSDATDELILYKALQSLASIFSMSVIQMQDMLTASYIFNWQNDVFALGGYSYDTIESSGAKKLLSTPLDKTLFFAGEALYIGEKNATVEAALQSAATTAKIILSDLIG